MSTGEKFLTGVVVVAALSLGAAGLARLPNRADIWARPFTHQAALNQPVHLRTGTLKVLDVQASPQVRDELGTAISNEGTFLVVTLEFTASHQPANVAAMTVQAADGRTFGGAPPVGMDFCDRSQPGIRVGCQIVFEVDKTALGGAKLRVPASLYGGGGDDVALVDLGLDTARAADLAARQAPLTVASSTVNRGP